LEEHVLTGERVRLRSVTEADLPLFVRWLNDPDVRYWQHRSELPPETLESQRARLARNRGDAGHLGWCIETLDGAAVGNVGLGGIDRTHGRAELYIFLGEKDCWGRGFGSDAIRAVLSFAFETLGLRRVYLTTDADNVRALRCFEGCGFKREGLLRAHRLRHGLPVDAVFMAALRERQTD
jgi:RimJ/RimL family protein N-acetyltransferase